MAEKRNSTKKKRKNPYVAGLAALDFKPDFDWEPEEAQALYEQAAFPIPPNTVRYEDCIQGMQSLPENIIDLVIADPPFGIEFDGRGSQYNRKTELVVEGYQEIQENYDAFTLAWVAELPRIMKNTATAFIFSGWTNLKDILVATEEARLALVNHIIWKYQFGVFTQKKFVSSHYHVLFLAKNPKEYFFNKIEHYPLDVWDIPRAYRPGQRKNGTKLPEDVVGRCIDFCSRPGDLVFDPFLGNGTTATCAKARYRHFFGFELNRQMQELLEENLSKVVAGQGYVPYHTLLPSPEDLAEKYPAVRRRLADKSLPATE
jgi:site-specific DNA-methyltransferase (adenine-specific)